jgi:lambda family phage portal protein
MNILENIISFFAPGVAAKRELDRYKLDLIKNQRGYEGASNGRRLGNWKAGSAGPNTENRDSYARLRDRSRDLFRNNAHSQKAIKVLTTHIVGNGIRPTFYLNLDKETSGAMKLKKGERKKKELEKAWKKYFEKTTCDFNGKKTFYSIQRMAARTALMSGDCIIRIRRNKSGFPFSFQVFEADIIDRSMEAVKTKVNGGFTSQGIEYDADGREVAYWLYDFNPNEYNVPFRTTSKRVPVMGDYGIPNFIHVYEEIRPGQAFGIPAGVSAFVKIRDLDEFTDAELVRQKLASCHVAFVYDSSPDSSNITRGEDGQMNERLTPGTIEYLPPGKQVTFNSPPSKSGFSDYVKKEEGVIAAGYNIPYEAMTGDFSNANFSSLKAGYNDFYKIISDLQEDLIINSLCEKGFEIFMKGCELMGIISASELEDYDVAWTAPARQMIDPVKEFKALSEAVRNGFKSWSEAQRELGYDPDQTIEEIKADYDKFDQHGFKLASDPRADPNRISAESQKVKPPA